MDIAPITLEGSHVRLESLSLDHLDPLTDVALDPDIWRWMPAPVTSRDDMRAWIEEALEWKRAGTAVPFATVERASGTVVGSTRFANISVPHRRVEIGWTWIAKPWQRTAVNSEAKYLMLRQAFDVWKVNRVELKTDVLNEKSRTAIRRIGAKEEGVLRRHVVNADGRVRDTVYYSIVREEWPDVAERLGA